jgi:hypothetical protein
LPLTMDLRSTASRTKLSVSCAEIFVRLAGMLVPPGCTVLSQMGAKSGGSSRSLLA